MTNTYIVVACTSNGKRIPFDTNHGHGYDYAEGASVIRFWKPLPLLKQKGVTMELQRYTPLWDLPDEATEDLPF